MAASTTLITDQEGMTPTAASLSNAAGATKGMDLLGMIDLYGVKLKETKELLTEINGVLDGADPTKTTVGNDLLTFS